MNGLTDTLAIVASALLLGCEVKTTGSTGFTPPPVSSSSEPNEDFLKDFSPNPVGKYALTLSRDGYLLRIDTQTGEVWMLIPPNTANNNKAFWKPVVEE